MQARPHVEKQEELWLAGQRTYATNTLSVQSKVNVKLNTVYEVTP
jgi:hypothetical protein